MNRSETGNNLKLLIEKIKNQNNITYPQMADILNNAGYPVQAINLRRIGHGIAQSLSVNLANGFIKCFGHTITAKEIFYAMGYEFVLDDDLKDHERELISLIRQLPEDTQLGITKSIKQGLSTLLSNMTKLFTEISK